MLVLNPGRKTGVFLLINGTNPSNILYMSNQAGKGDKPRPVVKETYDKNFDEIQGRGTMTGTLVKSSKGKNTYKY